MKIKFLIDKIDIHNILDESASVAKITIDDNRQYKTKQDVIDLKKALADIYGVEPYNVQTELEHQENILELAVMQHDIITATANKDSERGGDAENIKTQAQLHQLSRDYRKSLGVHRRKVTLLRNDYHNQGFWMKP